MDDSSGVVAERESEPIERMRALHEQQRAAFLAAPLSGARERRRKLRALSSALAQRQAHIADAVSADFGNRARPETLLAEILGVRQAAAHAVKHLREWLRPQRRGVAWIYGPGANRVEYAPLGVVGVVAPWNYPVLLTLGPLVDILAAGNRCMLKPSELTPRTSRALADLIADLFPEEEVAVVQGNARVGQAFCALPFDHLIFTGSTTVGREVMRSAAQHLVPITLELGGKSPVIVAEDFDVAKAARSVAAGKFFNAGQTCTAPDYALVTRCRAQAFAQEVMREALAMYPSLSRNPDYTTIVSDRHYARLEELVAEAERAGARVLRHPELPGRALRSFPPTVILEPPLAGRLMQEEIFGPILPVLSVEGIDDAIAFVNARPRPLALYLFTHERRCERRILERTRSGGLTLNGTMVQVAQTDLPFGGIGASGMGAYHGREGFLEFSHARAVHTPRLLSGFELLRAPYGRTMRFALRVLTGFRAD